MATGPCLGCGLSLDVDGNLQVTGVTNNEWPYTAPGHTNPDGWYCDTGTDGVERLWYKPWHLPWGIIGSAFGSGLGVYANGNGPQAVCGITVTLQANRRYLMTGSFAYQADVATVFEQANPFRGAVVGGSIWDYTSGVSMIGASTVAPTAGYSNFITLSRYLAPTSTITRTYAWRSYAQGLINCRPLNRQETFLLVEDIGPGL